tara:strand:- start:11951 stop:12184 length:234 start_codon:yes stop_codon:yes gene_type:complete
MQTIAEILSGPQIERCNSEARDGIPMTEANVRHTIATMERETKSKKARKSLALAAQRMPTISPEGKALYAAYAAALQ